jgi:hypothetical protein
MAAKKKTFQIILSLFLLSCSAPETEYGRDYNDYRLKHGVPIIEDDMELVQCVANICSWRSNRNSGAYHFRKIIWPSDDPKEWREEDHYVRIVNDTSTIKISVNAIFINDSIDWETYPPTYMVVNHEIDEYTGYVAQFKNLTIVQVDSVFNLWNLKR